MPLNKAAQNEQTKLLASAFNTAATSSVTVGILGPIAAALYGVSPADTPEVRIMAAACFWLLAAVALHLEGRRVLRGIIE